MHKQLRSHRSFLGFVDTNHIAKAPVPILDTLKDYLVNNFKEKLQFTDSVQLRLNTIYQNLKVTERPAVLENANLIAWSG